MRKKGLLFFLLLFPLIINAKIVKILHLGKTYSFAEENFLVELHQYMLSHKKEIEKKAYKLSKEAKQEIINFIPKGINPLTPADKNTTRIVALTYTLPYNIKDANGKVIYPKGFKFNPAKYVKLSYEIVILNAANKKEVNWFFKSKYSKNPLMYRVFLTGGNWYYFQKRYKHPVYYCLPQIEKRFKLHHTISIVKQIGNKFKIKEIAVN